MARCSGSFAVRIYPLGMFVRDRDITVLISGDHDDSGVPLVGWIARLTDDTHRLRRHLWGGDEGTASLGSGWLTVAQTREKLLEFGLVRTGEWTTQHRQGRFQGIATFRMTRRL